MARIKITGYIDTAELDADLVDLTHSTGLSPKGYDEIMGHDGSIPWKLTDLEDLESEIEQ